MSATASIFRSGLKMKQWFTQSAQLQPSAVIFISAEAQFSAESGIDLPATQLCSPGWIGRGSELETAWRRGREQLSAGPQLASSRRRGRGSAETGPQPDAPLSSANPTRSHGKTTSPPCTIPMSLLSLHYSHAPPLPLIPTHSLLHP